jgi:hypothetical protein
MSNKDSLIFIFLLVGNLASSQYDEVNMAASKMTKATSNAATNGSSTNQVTNHSSPSTDISARIYDRRH